MSQRTIRRVLTAGAVAGCLALAAPVHAGPRLEGPALGLMARLWSWLAPPLHRAAPAPGGGATQEKEGLGVDPNGGRGSLPTSSACQGHCEEGPGVDPDGP